MIFFFFHYYQKEAMHSQKMSIKKKKYISIQYDCFDQQGFVQLKTNSNKLIVQAISKMSSLKKNFNDLFLFKMS